MGGRDTSTYQNGELATKQLRAQRLLVRLQLHYALLQPCLLRAGSQRDSRHGHSSPPPTTTSPMGHTSPPTEAPVRKLLLHGSIFGQGIATSCSTIAPRMGKTVMGKACVYIYYLSPLHRSGCPVSAHAGLGVGEEIGVSEISMVTRLG